MIVPVDKTGGVRLAFTLLSPPGQDGWCTPLRTTLKWEELHEMLHEAEKIGGKVVPQIQQKPVVQQVTGLVLVPSGFEEVNEFGDLKPF
jgi:hypothetical protein